MTPEDRSSAAALVLLAKKLGEEYHKGRHEGINDRRLDVWQRRVNETWHTFIPRTEYLVKLVQAEKADQSEALFWLAKALCSEYYLGWHEGVGDRRDDVYKQKIEDNWHRWVPTAREDLLAAFPHLADKLP
jgi:hypothetical protein